MAGGSRMETTPDIFVEPTKKSNFSYTNKHFTTYARNIKYIGCTFEYCTFSSCVYRSITFLDCEFVGCVFITMQFYDSKATNCVFERTSFFDVNYGISFYDCNLKTSIFTPSRHTSDFIVMVNCKTNYATLGIHPAPEGELIGYKKVGCQFINEYIIKLRIPKEAKRSCALSRKFRCEYADVLDITPLGNASPKISIEHRSHFCIEPVTYEIGKRVYPDKWDENRWNECSHGIHFFLTSYEAETWGG